jgi:hypothetical protein
MSVWGVFQEHASVTGLQVILLEIGDGRVQFLSGKLSGIGVGRPLQMPSTAHIKLHASIDTAAAPARRKAKQGH